MDTVTRLGFVAGGADGTAEAEPEGAAAAAAAAAAAEDVEAAPVAGAGIPVGRTTFRFSLSVIGREHAAMESTTSWLDCQRERSNRSIAFVALNTSRRTSPTLICVFMGLLCVCVCVCVEPDRRKGVRGWARCSQNDL